MANIRDIMKPCFVTVRPETTLAEAARILGQQHVATAPVVTAGQAIVGMISEHELMDVLFDRAVRNAPVSQCMAEQLVVLSPDDPLSHAAQLFVLHGFRRLPVVDEGVLVGIVTRRDLLTHALDNDALLTEPLIHLMPELAPMS